MDIDQGTQIGRDGNRYPIGDPRLHADAPPIGSRPPAPAAIELTPPPTASGLPADAVPQGPEETG